MSYSLAGTIEVARERARSIGATQVRFILLDGHGIMMPSDLRAVGPNGVLRARPRGACYV